MKMLLITAIVALTAAVGSTSALAETPTTVSFTFPLGAVGFAPCALGGAGEEVTTSGTAHEVVQFVPGHHNVNFRVLHINYQALTGTGATSGDTYHAVAAETEIVPTDEFNVVTIAETIQFIGTGPDNNFQMHFVEHFTINASGEVTVSRYELRIECR
jgi:hypothetical protein